jgi:uncharacterized protein YdeI (YjbR/CyaY-like superfamily)
MQAMPDPKFFASANDFRKWLEKHHEKETELTVGFYKVASGRPSMTWSESVDQALCFGWIDGVRKSIDDKSYTIRFSPRRPNSIWSAINIRKVEELSEKGLMRPAGIAAFQKRNEERSAIYSYENRPEKLSSELEKKFRKNKRAWDFFQAQPPGYRRVAAFFVMGAKQEKTRISRLDRLILVSEAHERL